MSALTVARTLVKSPPELWSELRETESLAKHLGEFGEIHITRVDPETTVAWEGEHASGTVEIEPAGWGTKVTLTAVVARSEQSAPEADAEAGASSQPEPGPDDEARPGTPRVHEPLSDELDRIATRAHESFWDHLDAWPRPDPSEAATRDNTVAADAPPPAPGPEPRGRRWLRAWRWRRRRRADAPEAEPAPAEPAQEAAEPAETTAAQPPARRQPTPLTDARAAERRAVVEGPPPPAPPEPAGIGADRAREALEQTLDSLGSAHHRPFSRG